MNKLKPIEETALYKGVDGIQSIILIILGIAMVTVTVVAVVMRYIFNSQLFGSDELLSFIIIWSYWMGGAYGSFEDSHISADITGIMIKNKKVLRTVRIIQRLLTVMITAVLAYWAVAKYMPKIMAQNNVTTALRMPLVIGRMSSVVGMVLMFFFSLYWLYREIRPYTPTVNTDEKTAEGGNS